MPEISDFKQIVSYLRVISKVLEGFFVIYFH